MILIDTHTPKTFEEYLLSLDKKGRKEYRKIFKKTKDLEFRKVPYNREEMIYFMNLWENQLIYGAKRKWVFGIDYLDRLEKNKRLMCFSAFKGEEKVCLHFLENHNGYLESHPPMYDKTKYLDVSISRYMRFNLIKYAIESDIDWIDLGGGIDNWRDMIKRRKEFSNSSHKWIFVSKDAKINPENQPNLTLKLPEGRWGDIKYLE